MLTDCSSIQGSTASSSSDVMTLATTSPWCAISIPTSASAAAPSTRLRVIRLVRPHARRILVTPDFSPSFGFTVRGGKEFGTGFFVSNVERSSEAELKGMRIGDQILRINGFRIDDAVHRELIQFITNQDRITLKVRSVGMLPIKENGFDKLSWHAVKAFTNGSSASSESSYKIIPERDAHIRCKDVNITLDVAPRTKLGLGICKGPEWKPGIFVQFTKERSVAREAGLRQGDQILSVNSIDFSDVLFSEAVAVMKSANKLEMIVRTAAGCDLFPGESSGYNSSASSVTGDQSPCWADAKSKRLTSVREESSTITTAPNWNESEYVQQQRRLDQHPDFGNKQQHRDAEEVKNNNGSQQKVNKTIIKLSEKGTSINNTFVRSNPQPLANAEMANEYETLMPANNTFTMRDEQESKKANTEAHRQSAENIKQQQQYQNRYDCNNHNRNNMLQPTHYFINKTSPATRQSEFSNRPRTNSCNPQYQQKQQMHQTNPQQQNMRHGCNTLPTDSSSLSSAITEELKKRKEKQRMSANSNNGNYIENNIDNNKANSKHQNYSERRQQQQQHQQQQHPTGNALRHKQQGSNYHSEMMTTTTTLSPSSSSLSLSTMPTSPTTTASAHTFTSANASTTLGARATSNIASGSERNSNNNRSHISSNSNCSGSNSQGGIPVAGSAAITGIGVGTCDQHSALMDEFKRAHQRMFKNGFQETESKERQDALRNTTIMEDDVNHRTSRIFRNENAPTTNGGAQFQMPPPPPQFASSPPRTQSQSQAQQQQQQHQQPQYTNNVNNKFGQQKQQHKAINNNHNNNYSTPIEQPPEPPATPAPDYDNVEIRTIAPATTITSTMRPSHGYASTNLVTNGRGRVGDSKNHNNHYSGNNKGRHSMTTRLGGGTVTIGEYEQSQQRREPAKFDFVNTPKRYNSTTDVSVDDLQAELQNTLRRSKLRKSADPLEHQSNCPLRSNYDNYENVARKLHSVSINEVATVVPARMSNSNSGTGMCSGGTTNGILKNGNRHGVCGGGEVGTKSSDKTITFGN